MNTIFVSFDTETTGLSSVKDQIIELAGVKFTTELQGNKRVPVVLDTFEEFVKPTILIPAEATAINHITDAMVDNADSVEQVIPRFIKFCGLSSVLVAHNADFDRKFLAQAIASHKLTTLKNPIIDSLRIARKVHPEYPNHKQETLAKRLSRAGKIELDLHTEKLHRALYDCEVLAKVFAGLLTEGFTPADLQRDSFLKSVQSVHAAPLFC